MLQWLLQATFITRQCPQNEHLHVSFFYTIARIALAICPTLMEQYVLVASPQFNKLEKTKANIKTTLQEPAYTLINKKPM